MDEHLAIQLIHRHATQIWKQIFLTEHNMLKIPTGRRQTSGLFYKCDREVEPESTVKQLQLVVSEGLELRSEDLQISSLAP